MNEYYLKLKALYDKLIIPIIGAKTFGMRIHLGNHYKCASCGMKFRVKFSIMEHIRKEHYNEL